VSDSQRLAAYLAGPEVFLPNGAEIGAAKKEICNQHGLEGLFPGDIPEADSRVENGRLLFRRLVQMMEHADLIIANMTPFRGVSMDVGTAMEIGFMHSRGCRVFGYTNVSHDYAERVAPGGDVGSASGALSAPDGMSIEPFKLTDNLMCVAPVLESGATVVRNDVPEHERFSNLRGFEECVRQATAGLKA
jgi:nucleoside 2-deoxyribosyltransferase